MALVAAVTECWHDGRRLHVIGTITTSGNYATGGDTLSFAGLVKSSRVPSLVQIGGITAGTAHLYRFIPGSTQANGKMQVVLVSTGAELGVTTYPTDTISFYAIFEKLV